MNTLCWVVAEWDSLALGILSGKKRTFSEVPVGNLHWYFHTMAAVGSRKDWEIRDGHRGGQKPRVFRQTKSVNNGFYCGTEKEILSMWLIQISF